MSCCLWPYWMRQSQGTQSPFRAWINGSWLDFGGLLCCFCLLWHRPSLCEVSMLLSDKGATSFGGGREKWGDRNWGRGDHWEGGVKAVSCSSLSRCLLPCCCVCVRRCKCKHLCFHVSIFVRLWPCDSDACAVMEHNLLNISRVCLVYDNTWLLFSPCVYSWIFLLLLSQYFAPATPLYSAEELENGKERHLHVTNALKFPSIHYTRKCKSKWHPVLYLIPTSNSWKLRWMKATQLILCVSHMWNYYAV